MAKFNINDEVYQAGFGLKDALFVWKINHEKTGVTYTCSAIKGRDEKVYNDKQVYTLAEFF